MGFYGQRILPNLIGCVCSRGAIMKQRAKVVPKARGRVLEVGIGAAPNLELYDSGKVEQLIGVDPSAGMRRKAAKKLAGTAIAHELLDAGGEALPLDDASVDTIVLTYTLCSIPDAEQAMREMRRVLKPEGQLLFCEHGRAPDPGVVRWQERIEPVWKRIAGGCHLARPMDRLIVGGGFAIREMEAEYMPGSPRFSGFDYIGTATPV
ncbi:class I SAM-dependent methyltransferase [Maricaulis alexandrii]|jgi:ubiquinone/menaquinone biosynthesis C-methylase UbiE|uniref:class I SAM-dependent methyltransferase n=1 Tax=Maricaulis alexandrii TaxID=2570354 RepID=UPI001107F3FD|nr:class I SAM-dependent methyltransferase [Maricaulis alexandrii]